MDKIPEGSREEYVTIRNTTSNINRYMREICKILDIPEKITTGTARHAFATTLMQNEVPIAYISSALGHASIKTTQNYLDGYTEQQINSYAQLLTRTIKE